MSKSHTYKRISWKRGHWFIILYSDIIKNLIEASILPSACDNKPTNPNNPNGNGGNGGNPNGGGGNGADGNKPGSNGIGIPPNNDCK